MMPVMLKTIESPQVARQRRTSAATVLVFGVWALATIAAAGFVLLYGQNSLYGDEWEVVPQLSGREPISPAWLFRAHIEHRVPLQNSSCSASAG